MVKYAIESGLNPSGLTYSPVKGAKGNIEYLLYIDGKSKENCQDIVLPIIDIVNASHEELE